MVVNSASPGVRSGDVKSARRVLELLRFFARSLEPASLTDIAKELAIPKSSCLALLDTLVGEGYAYLLDGRYYLTARWADEGRAVALRDPVTIRFRPALLELAEAVGETVVLAHLSVDDVVYLDALPSAQVVRFTASAGQRKPLHPSASGRALLSTLPDAALDERIARLEFERFTATTPTGPAELAAKIRREREQGYHVNRGEYERHTLSVAAPVLGPGDPLALVVGAPLSRAEGRIETIGESVARIARAYSALERD